MVIAVKKTFARLRKHTQKMALVKLSLPTFAGTGGASEIQHFIELFESYCDTMHLTANHREMSVFSHCMKPSTKAAEWWRNVKDTNANCATWEDTKTLLLGRFNKKKNPGELAALVGTLQQKKDESVDDYKDRVDSFTREIAREIPDGWTPEHKIAARNTLREVQAKIHFLVGLRVDLRKRVCAEDITSLEQYQAAARRAENALIDTRAATSTVNQQPTRPIYVSAVDAEEVDKEIDEATAYIDYLRAGGRPQQNRAYAPRGRGAYRGGATGAGQQRQQVTRGSKRPTWISFSRLPPNTCYTCGMQGHVSTDCRVPEKNYRWDLAVQTLLRANTRPGVNEIGDAQEEKTEDETNLQSFDALEAEMEKCTPHFQ